MPDDEPDAGEETADRPADALEEGHEDERHDQPEEGDREEHQHDEGDWSAGHGVFS